MLLIDVVKTFHRAGKALRRPKLGIVPPGTYSGRLIPVGFGDDLVGIHSFRGTHDQSSNPNKSCSKFTHVPSSPGGTVGHIALSISLIAT